MPVIGCALIGCSLMGQTVGAARRDVVPVGASRGDVVPVWASRGMVAPVGTSGGDTVSIRRYGAVAGGKMLNTRVIQQAIDACHEGGGGVVLIPAGEWLTGPIVLKSGVNLSLAAGALLQFTRDFNQYPLIKGNFEGLPAVRNQPPLSADGAEDIGITGSGIIDGGGDAWRPVKKNKAPPSVWASLVASGGVLSGGGKTWYPSASSLLGSETKDPGVWEEGKTIRDYDNIKDFLRPNLLVLSDCKRVLLEGVTFRNSPAWCLHPLLCTNLTIRGITVQNPPYAQNGDGIDIESCADVLVENSSFDAGDDGICLKSGRDSSGRKRGVPTQRVIIRHCTVYHAHGGFVIGSEMSGGIRDVEVYDCAFLGTDVGLRFKSARGRGGVVENIKVHDIYMKDIAGEAILFDMYYMAVDPIPRAGDTRVTPRAEMMPVTSGTPCFRNFRVSHIVCDGAAKGVFIRGLPEMNIQDVVLEHLSLKATEGIEIQDAERIALKDVSMNASDTRPLISLINSRDILFDSLRYPPGAGVLFRVEGERSAGVIVTHTDVKGAGTLLERGDGVAPRVLSVEAGGAAGGGAVGAAGGDVSAGGAVGDGGTYRLVVDPSGKGDFRTIQEAINSLPDDSAGAGGDPGRGREDSVAARGIAARTRVIFIRKGVYDEKIFLDKNHVELLGEDSATTVITQSIARDIWRCSGNASDWGVATLNLSGSDIQLNNLTIENEYGFEHKGDTTVACGADSLRRVTPEGHQMALRSFRTTRLKVVHCLLKAYGGDTVSPWNVQEGLFYFKDCTMEGGVDLYCPRGWAYAEACRFIAYNGPACIWHDGSASADAKTVLRDCTFQGYEGFHLGRYHKDAQFYLVNCTFGSHMADAKIALVRTDSVLRWGERVFYYNCHREGGDYAWFSDNLDKAPGSPSPGEIGAGWVFGAKWNPEAD